MMTCKSGCLALKRKPKKKTVLTRYKQELSLYSIVGLAPRRLDLWGLEAKTKFLNSRGQHTYNILI